MIYSDTITINASFDKADSNLLPQPHMKEALSHSATK